MKNKNGFTMVELLAVLVVLAVITAITMPVITSTLKESRESSYDRQLLMEQNHMELKTLVIYQVQEVLKQLHYAI